VVVVPVVVAVVVTAVPVVEVVAPEVAMESASALVLAARVFVVARTQAAVRTQARVQELIPSSAFVFVVDSELVLEPVSAQVSVKVPEQGSEMAREPVLAPVL
jgi:hypothetical protein